MHFRDWLVTSTTYASWLPGDARGFVGHVRETRPDDPPAAGRRRFHNKPQTRYDSHMPGLEAASAQLAKGPVVLFDASQALAVLEQFQETSNYRGWYLHAASVMANHVHLVVTAPTDVDREDLLRDFKSYASRRLNRQWGKPSGGTWWTVSGSCRPLRGGNLQRPIRYVLRQSNFLCRYLHPDYGPIECWLEANTVS